MVVIIILAVLTGIAIPSYLALRNRARIQAARSEMTNIGTALAVYAADNGDTYPTTVEGLAILETSGHMENVPAADPWGTDAYDYAYVGAGGVSYTLTCTGADPDIVMSDGVFSGE
jgi:general secretion pathway protein G